MGRWITGCLSVLAILVVAKGYGGWHQAQSDAPKLLVEAASLIAQGRGANDLGEGRAEQFLAIRDPNFFKHNGVDLPTRGPATAGTVTQSLTRPVATASMVPGVSKVSHLTYALALDERLPKAAQLALYLDRVDMGHSPDGVWITGFFNAAQTVYGRLPANLSDAEFLTLVSVIDAPSTLPMAAPSAQLQTDVASLGAILSGN
jgi:membrane carboxypeptidase/penicillin-binding protein